MSSSIYDDSASSVCLRRFNKSGSVTFLDIAKGVKKYNGFNQNITRRFYIQYNTSAKTDTIFVHYTTHEKSCDVLEVSYLKLFFNDSLYFDAATNRLPWLHFKRRR
jgi:hypothetical protein